MDKLKNIVQEYYRKWQSFQQKKPVLAALILHGSGVVLASFVILWSIFNVLMPIYTKHGKSKEIPNVVKKKLPEAIDELESKGLTVRLDSVYDEKRPTLTVLDQYPKGGYTYKKRNREVIITYNMSKPPLVELPDLKGQSLDIVKEQMKSLKINIGNINYVPYPYSVFVEYQYKGKSLSAGKKIQQGETLDIIMGSGQCNKILTPVFTGLTLKEAIRKAEQYGLEYEVDSSKYIQYAQPGRVYSQSPGIRDSVCKGERVILVITTYKKKKK